MQKFIFCLAEKLTFFEEPSSVGGFMQRLFPATIAIFSDNTAFFHCHFLIYYCFLY